MDEHEHWAKQRACASCRSTFCTHHSIFSTLYFVGAYLAGSALGLYTTRLALQRPDASKARRLRDEPEQLLACQKHG